MTVPGETWLVPPIPGRRTHGRPYACAKEHLIIMAARARLTARPGRPGVRPVRQNRRSFTVETDISGLFPRHRRRERKGAREMSQGRRNGCRFRWHQERPVTMPARFPFARRAPAAIPGAERPPAIVPASPAQASSVRHAARWTVGPGSQDDEWLHRNRRHQRARADGPTMLTRPAVRAAPFDAASASAQVTAAAPGYGRGRAPQDFSAVPAHRPAPDRQATVRSGKRSLI